MYSIWKEGGGWGLQKGVHGPRLGGGSSWVRRVQGQVVQPCDGLRGGGEVEATSFAGGGFIKDGQNTGQKIEQRLNA